MTDYEAMCGNKMMVRMMSKVIGCEEKQLKKFCKYINVFAENIESSPKSIKNKMKAIELLKANRRKIHWAYLSENPNAIDLLKANYDKINWGFLSYNINPEAIELLKENQDKIDWINFSENSNPEAI